MMPAEGMPIEIPERVEFLTRSHLFNGLNQEQYEAVAQELTELTIPAGKEIVKQGEIADCLYLVWSGKADRQAPSKDQLVTTYSAGNNFGEESLLVKRHKWTASVVASEVTVVLMLRRQQYLLLVKQVPVIKTNLTVAVNSHRLHRQTLFKWLQPAEIIYFMSRKHPVLLLQKLVVPLLLAFVAVIGMLVAWYYSLWVPALAWVWWLSLIAGICALGWGVWAGFDWSNDYYLITDRRVIWVEKVIGIYESRQEAPLSAIQRVNVETDLTGRLMDYGNLIISTIVGNTLKLLNVEHPNQAAALIDQHWRRSKEMSNQMEQEQINEMLRARLLDQNDEPAKVPGIVAVQVEKKDPYEDQRGFANLFRQRFEKFSTITYRKHIFVLFEQLWKPGLILFILAGLMAYELLTPNPFFPNLFKVSAGWLMLIWLVLVAAALLWNIYEYVDWSNDIFQVTPEQILDLDKTPLGEVTSDIAALENILSIEHKRVGILALLFNYGTVFITIGGGREMSFDNVYNPSAVQEDIERRRLEKVTKREQDRINAERTRTADWFAAYFKSEQQLREENTPGNKDPEKDLPKNDLP